jgi:hypothetical protein
MNLIEKLKDKDYVRAFGLMTLEEQKCFEKTGKENCLYYSGYNGWRLIGGVKFYKEYTYAIKSDYQPEPEFVKIRIYKSNDDFLGIYKENAYIQLPHNFVHLHCIPSMPNFDHFEREDKNSLKVAFEDISRLISENIIVYAVFRKE